MISISQYWKQKHRVTKVTNQNQIASLCKDKWQITHPIKYKVLQLWGLLSYD